MQIDSSPCAQRTVGRLFSKAGCLHFVLKVDASTGLADVSCRINEVTEVVTMPISEVVERLGTSNALKLDRLNSDETEQRVVEKDSDWFFHAREGEFGPFASEETAKRALTRHILSAQEEGRTGRPAAQVTVQL